MPQLVADCPRCAAKNTTFDVRASHDTGRREYDWVIWFEAFCVCRNCKRSTVFMLRLNDYSARNEAARGVESTGTSTNAHYDQMGFVSLKDNVSNTPPDHLPSNIENAFKEASTCSSVGCYNAAATMYRLCIDHATRALLPQIDQNGLNKNIRRSLGLRLIWLLNNGILPESLRDLSTCVKEDGNDGAHEGTLSKEDADDLYDFTFVLLERIYTEPERIKQANARRALRRNPAP